MSSGARVVSSRPRLRDRLNERDFNYGYIEPGLNYELNERWEWTLGVRFDDSIGGFRGAHE